MPEERKRLIYLKGENKTEKIQDFRKVGNKYEVTFKDGKVFKYNASNVRIIEPVLNEPKSRECIGFELSRTQSSMVLNESKSCECFDYLKRIAIAVGLKTVVDGGKTINILAHNYLKIQSVISDSMLGAFLCRNLPEDKQYNSELIADTVYPFGFNISQKDAVDKALVNKLSIIEGPPGTGKTQTILNIIANVVMRGESVAVVSSNNSATKNILDKLKKYDVDFITAYLGNMDNKRNFINSQKLLPDMTDWKLTSEDFVALRQLLRLRYGDLQEKISRQNELSVLKQELSAIKTEEKHFLQYFYSIDIYEELQEVQESDTSQKALEMWLLCENEEKLQKNKGLIAFVERILDYLRIWKRRKMFVRKLLKQYSHDYLVAVFQRRFYELKISELNESISKLVNELELFNFSAKMSEYSDLSAQLFRAMLSEKYTEKDRKIYEFDDLWRSSETFIKDYPVILSTTYSLRSSLSSRVMYDYLIVDESSQVDLCTGALALSCARKAVIVGDLKQLSNVVDAETANITDAIFSEYDLSEVYRYKNHNLLSAMTEMFPDVPNTLLREHYRCHPKIIEFCNKKFYSNQLVIFTEPKSEREPLIVYKIVEGNHERNRVNQRQIDVIKNEIIPQQQINTTDGSLGIVTPYRNQTNALSKAFIGMKVKADTVDKFQGQENAVVILSTVDNEISKFTDDANRLNVAISRAIEQLIVVVNAEDTLKDKNIGDLVRYIEYNCFKVIDSKVYSVFDYLYRSYAKRRREFLVKNKRVSKYDSENLMYALIISVLKDKGLNSLEIAVHVPLKMIIRDVSLMTPLEKQYSMNILTHVDFLIFNSIDKSPLFVVEVDGVAFHKEGTRQAERDTIKNDILNKYGLPILRFRTDGSDERKQLIDLLDCIFGSSKK